MEFTLVRQKMEKALEALGDDLAQVRAGRATPALVEKIMVDAYNTRMPLVELATITAPEPNQLVIAPFDQSIIKDIQAAFHQHQELKLSPVVDENLIRIQIPPLTAERREELVKLLGQKLEAGRIMIRQIRQEKKSEIKQAADSGQLSEDEKFESEKQLQELTEEFLEKMEKMGEAKEAELRSV